jgi:hypothetical protein
MGWAVSESTVGVNLWLRAHLVWTCSTGPPVDSQVQRSRIWAGAVQAGSGQEMVSGIGSSESWVRRLPARYGATV